MSLKKYSLLLLIICAFILGLTLKTASYTPKVSPIDLTPILSKQTLDEADYLLIFEQTGIAEPLVQELRTMPHFTEKMLKFQADYLKKRKFKWIYLFPCTFEERLVDEAHNEMIGYDLGPYHNGYIFFTKAAHSLGWHHGHCGLVVDEKHGKTLEAIHMGEGCALQDVYKWQYYPSFKMMRLKDVSLEKQNEIASYAYENLINAKYQLISFRYKEPSFIPSKTQCALLIWQAFYHFGYDLDTHKQLFVTPKAICRSPLLELLQMYGFNPKKVW